MRSRVVLGVTVALVMPLLLAPGPVSSATTTTVMLVGDSLTQGSSGDWTWRYRLWQHLTSSGAAVDLVGPRNDLYDNVAWRPGSQEYADPAFDTDHAASWGSSFRAPGAPIGELMRVHHPDVVVEMLGFNDLWGYHAAPAEVAASAADFVRSARAVDPQVEIVLVELPQTWIPGVVEFNAALTDVQRTLTTDDSRVVVARSASPLQQSVDTWDPAHPSASGEIKIAAGVADALSTLGVGPPYARPLPTVPNGPRRPAEVRMVADDLTADLRWTLPPGATAAYVWRRDVSMGQAWTREIGPLLVDTWRVSIPLVGHDYAFRVQATKGEAVARDVFSNTVTVTRPTPGIALIRAHAHRRSLRLRWWTVWPVARDVRYRVTLWRPGHREKAAVRLTTSRALRLVNLRPGAVYRVVVRAWKGSTAGRRATTTVALPSRP